ncbi:MAG: phage tail family protein [Acidimicrobiia bacterium]|nr:phage tail family protein [Acidimicrobiia bacterium]
MSVYTFRGLTMGDGTDVLIDGPLTVESLDVDIQNDNLPAYHGAIPGDSYAVGSSNPLKIVVVGTALTTLTDQVLAAFAPSVSTEDPFVWDDRLRYCRVKSRKVTRKAGSTVVNVLLSGSDPAIYAAVLSSDSLAVFATSAGLSYPVTYPKTYGAAGSGAGTVVSNNGTWETWPTLTINGPTSGVLTDPIIENVTTGKTIALSAEGGAQIGVGQQLVIVSHPRIRSIAFASGASRYLNLFVNSEFFPLAPGNNELRFKGSGVTTDASCDVEWRDAWI